MLKLTLAVSALLPLAAVLSASGVQDNSLKQFPRLPGETDDAPRFQRAVDACRGGGVLCVQYDYFSHKPLPAEAAPNPAWQAIVRDNIGKRCTFVANM